jgi:hypothetical protein
MASAIPASSQPLAKKKYVQKLLAAFEPSTKSGDPQPPSLSPVEQLSPKPKAKAKTKTAQTIIPDHPQRRKRDDPPETINQFLPNAHRGLKKRKVDDDDEDYSENVWREMVIEAADVLRQFVSVAASSNVFKAPSLASGQTVFDALLELNLYPPLEAFLLVFVDTLWAHLSEKQRSQVWL